MLYALLFAATAFGLRSIAGRVEATDNNPNLWTGLSLMTTAWALDVPVGAVMFGLLWVGIFSAGLLWYRSDRSLSVDVTVE